MFKLTDNDKSTPSFQGPVWKRGNKYRIVFKRLWTARNFMKFYTYSSRTQ